MKKFDETQKDEYLPNGLPIWVCDECGRVDPQPHPLGGGERSHRPYPNWLSFGRIDICAGCAGRRNAALRQEVAVQVLLKIIEREGATPRSSWPTTKQDDFDAYTASYCRVHTKLAVQWADELIKQLR